MEFFVGESPCKGACSTEVRVVLGVDDCIGGYHVQKDV